jgi:predicted TIM-barrel fold metal-dependent hydrolase
MLIDIHAHVYPDNVANKVTAHLKEHYGISIKHQGTLQEYRKLCKKIGVNYAVVFTAATKPEQVEPANRWAMLNHRQGNLISFGTMHPHYTNIDGEIKRLRDAGIIGIKLHPDFQQFYLDDALALTMYEKLAKHFIILFHVGDDQVPDKTNYATPERMARVLELVPGLRAIAAHMGGYQMWDRAMECLVGKNIFFDTSSSYYFLAPEKMRLMVDSHGYQRVLLGSDYPFNDPYTEATCIKKLLLPEKQFNAIIGGNARKLLGSCGL